MNETSFLGGKVRKISLPEFHGPPPAGATGPKRLHLAQGELANFYNGEAGMRYLAFMELRVGGIRGNHFHRKKQEWVYLISGRLLLVVQEGETGTPISINLRAGDLVTIETGIAHAFNPLDPGQAVEFSPASFDPADIQKFTVI
jgi:hypothetical protein